MAPVQFVFSPALYPQSPLENNLIFVHGKITETKNRNGETILKARDEKGEWEGFADPSKCGILPTGERIRAYGAALAQPDGKLVLSMQWVKKIGEEEYTYCENQTRAAWEKLVQQHPALTTLNAYQAPAPKIIPHAQPIAKKNEPSTQEFISASELKIEREYL